MSKVDYKTLVVRALESHVDHLRILLASRGYDVTDRNWLRDEIAAALRLQSVLVSGEVTISKDNTLALKDVLKQFEQYQQKER